MTWTHATGHGTCTCGQPYDEDDVITVDGHGQATGCRRCQPTAVPATDLPDHEEHAA